MVNTGVDICPSQYLSMYGTYLLYGSAYWGEYISTALQITIPYWKSRAGHSESLNLHARVGLSDSLLAILGIVQLALENLWK